MSRSIQAWIDLNVKDESVEEFRLLEQLDAKGCHRTVRYQMFRDIAAANHCTAYIFSDQSSGGDSYLSKR